MTVEPSLKVTSARTSSRKGPMVVRPSASTASGSAGFNARARSMSWIIRSSTVETSALRGPQGLLRTANMAAGGSGMARRPMAANITRSR
jgi:hypothetical protein